ncbi:Chromate resistance exported protein [Thioflavicoccus mobilis 8321]|uniref:Chromate resistance exported protein n=1 Tax=Thioflavicoccus mobilis 8321 TaxID=765912 RepID=L0GXI4_9GAMM|nr:chromate resistance protein ChrB domain-containing protein [Thioflavicoccus mobilis]AGA90537.1 Chromate resistance exported protein [Thioflavicoccus mobilis 8321]
MVQRHAAKLILPLLCFLLWVHPVSAQDRGNEHIYVTWGIFEPDKCAAIWLVKRHIDPDARFVFFERNEAPPPGIGFDIPEAQFRRYHNRCTYETLLDHHGLIDRRLVYIGRIMHDIEVNVWERKAMEETPRVEREVMQLFSEDDTQGNVDACLEYFDELYSRL